MNPPHFHHMPLLSRQHSVSAALDVGGHCVLAMICRAFLTCTGLALCSHCGVCARTQSIAAKADPGALRRAQRAHTALLAEHAAVSEREFGHGMTVAFGRNGMARGMVQRPLPCVLTMQPPRLCGSVGSRTNEICATRCHRLMRKPCHSMWVRNIHDPEHPAVTGMTVFAANCILCAALAMVAQRAAYRLHAAGAATE